MKLNQSSVLIVGKFLQIIQSLLHHPSISAFIKQAAKFLPGIPGKLKVHIPLKGKGICGSMMVNFPSTHKRSPSWLLHLVQYF